MMNCWGCIGRSDANPWRFGEYKREHNATHFQLERWNEILRTRPATGAGLDLNKQFVVRLMELIPRRFDSPTEPDPLAASRRTARMPLYFLMMDGSMQDPIRYRSARMLMGRLEDFARTVNKLKKFILVDANTRIHCLRI